MYRRRSDLAKHFAPRQTPGRRGSTDQQTAAQRVLFQELQADAICWELFLRGQTCGSDTVYRLHQLSHPRSHESGKVWEGLGKELGRLFRERAACAGSQSADSLGCSLGALLAMPCLLACLPACLPCLALPPSLAFPAFRHSVNLLCCWCHAQYALQHACKQ